MVRWTKFSDRDEIRALWELRFQDRAPFVDWFFRERFSPDHSAVSVEDGHVVSSIQSWPCHMRIRDAVLPCCIVAGVSTLPACEGRGHMRRTMEFFMRGIADRGGSVVTYRPEIPAMYAGFGHRPISRTAYFHGEACSSESAPGAEMLDPVRDFDEILACYKSFSRRYSVIICRSAPDMRLKLADYLADGGKLIGFRRDGTLMGYCVYFDYGEDIWAEELISGDAEVTASLLRTLGQIAAGLGKPLGGKLPPDAVPFPDCRAFSVEIRPMNLMGVGCVQTLLREIGRGLDFHGEITDPVVPGNCGCFSFTGEISDKAPQFRTSAGGLAQLLCGYTTLSNLASNGDAEILDTRAAAELDAAFPQQNCFIVDEY